MYGYGGQPPPTNNPYINTALNPSERYPEIPPTQPQSTTWADPTLLTGVHPQQQQQYNRDYQQYPQVSHQQIPPGYPQQPIQPLQPPIQSSQQPHNYPYPPPQPHPSTSFQHSSSFGQGLQPPISGSSYGYLQSGHNQPPPPQQTSAYNPAQQPHQNNPNYISQFDPLSNFQNGATDTTTPQSQPLTSPSSNLANNINGNFGYGINNHINSGPAGFSPSGLPHPRDYIRSNKQQIEAWDKNTWQQLLKSCEALKRSWESKRNELKDKLSGLHAQLRYAGYYNPAQIQQEGVRIQAVS